MTKTITKRDGREVTFDRSKIASAVSKALAATPKGDDKELAESIAKDVERDVMCSTHQWGVEDIQDKVEYYLMASLRKDAAKAYIAYRTKRTLARKASTLKVYQSIVEAQANEVTRENANMNADTPAGMMMKFASEATKPFVDECLLSDDVREAVANNYIHIHDKDYYPTKSLTCLQHPLDKILEHGFQAGHGESRAAKRIETAAILACISMETVQNEMHGGQAIPAFDFYLAPYVKMTFEEEVKKLEGIVGEKLEYLHDVKLDDYTHRPLEETSSWSERALQSCINQTVWRVHQAMESFIHNMNTIHSRGGNQVVFSSINYGTDTSAEGRCIIREMLNCTYEGVGNGSTAIFPIQIWKKKRGVNYLPGDPNYDLFLLACRVSARRFFPNFLNLDAPFNKDEAWDANDPKRYMHEVATMGCVDGKEVITWRKDNKIHVTSFEEFWKEMSKTSIPESATSEGYSEGEFIDLNGIEIDDNGVFVDCLRVIKNPDKSNWMKVTLSNGRALTATADHPWSILRGDKQEVIHTDKLLIGDEVRIVADQQTGYVTKIEFIGFRDECSYDVTTSSEHFTVSGIRSHNCRTRVYENRFGEKTSVGRGNLSFTTINLVRLALESKENYIERLDSVLEIAAKQLHERFKFQQTALKKQFPLLMNGLWVGSDALKPTDSVADLLNQGTLGIGFIGLAETLVALTGKHHGESEEAQKLGLKIITHMRDKAIEFSERYGHNYSIIATPAEGLSGKFTKADKKKFGEIPGVTDREYYTNSNHVPVYYHCTPQHKAEVEAPYHALTLGGHIFYVEIDGDATHNPEAIKAVVDLMDRYGLGYGSVNHNRNRCLDCGYEDAQAGLTSCPRCGSHNIDVLQRITGYLVGTTERWNEAKLAELKDRVVHK